ncbi:MAG TPA: D-glycerate dehydrogenase [Symbiobacteriaceae bacterium]|jgi:glyoxylate reductase
MTKPFVYVCRQLPDAAHKMLEEHFECEVWGKDEAVPRALLLEKAAKADGILSLLTDKVNEELLAVAKNLKIVANYAVGFDNIDVPACTRHKVMATNTPGVLTDTTADLAWTLLMCAGRRIVESERFTKSGQWKTWGPLLLAGQDIHHATLGLVGLGRIGAAVARRAKGFDMKVVYFDPYRNEQAEQELGVEYMPLDDVLKVADFISVHVPLMDSTRNLIAARELGIMKKTAVLVNTSRGGIVNEPDLYHALKDGAIFAAGLDVFAQEPTPLDNPLLTLDNCTCVPHIASASVQTRTRMGTLAAENVIAALTGKKPPTLLNPEVLG